MSLPYKLFTTLFASSSNQSLRNLLIRSTGGTFALRIFSLSVNFITGVLLARMLDVRHYGAFNFALSWLTGLSLITLLGFDRLLQRETAYFKVQENWGRLKGLWRFSWQISLGLSLLVAGGIFLIEIVLPPAPVRLPFLTSPQLQVFQTADSMTQQTIWLALVALPFVTLIKLCFNFMQGLRQVVRGQVPESVIQPLLFIGLVGATYLLTGRPFSAPWAMFIRNVVLILVSAYALRQVLRSLPEPTKTTAPVIEGRRWLRQVVPLSMLNLLLVIRSRADFILLGLLLNVDAVALYSVAFMLATLVILALNSAGASLSPTFATLYAQGDYERLENVAVKSARAIMLASLPVVFGLIVFGKPILSLYGPAYLNAYPALLVMVIGQFVNLGTGSVGPLLTMTGHEKYTLIGQTVGAILYVVLLIVLIPPLGIVGAAIATTLNLITWNLLLAWFAWREMGIVTTALGRFRLPRLPR